MIKLWSEGGYQTFTLSRSSISPWVLAAVVLAGFATGVVIYLVIAKRRRRRGEHNSK